MDIMNLFYSVEILISLVMTSFLQNQYIQLECYL